MNKKSIAVLGSALALSLLPFSASAYTAETALNACAAALTTEMSGGELAYKIDERSDGGKRLRGVETFHLDARDPASDEVVARADCVVDGRARVKWLKTLPLDAADASERALTAY